MFKIMNKIMDKCDRYNRLKIILNQVRGHCLQRKFLLQQNCKYLESIA
jgi:hypothetical protein